MGYLILGDGALTERTGGFFRKPREGTVSPIRIMFGTAGAA